MSDQPWGPGAHPDRVLSGSSLKSSGIPWYLAPPLPSDIHRRVQVPSLLCLCPRTPAQPTTASQPSSADLDGFCSWHFISWTAARQPLPSQPARASPQPHSSLEALPHWLLRLGPGTGCRAWATRHQALLHPLLIKAGGSLLAQGPTLGL